MSVVEDLKKPFNLMSTAIAVVSLLLSIYFYFESVQRREPLFLVKSTTQIYSKSVTSPNFNVVDGTGKRVEGNINVLEVSLWNNGRLGIEPQDVRTPVFVEFPPETRLLDRRVAKENKPAISSVQLKDLAPEVSGGPRVGISWAHLDPGVGARLQFIYVGEPNAPIKIRGDILDAEITSAAGLLKRVASEWVRLAAFAALAFAAIAIPESRLLPKPNFKSRIARLAASAVTLLLVYGLLLGIGWLLFVDKSPPV